MQQIESSPNGDEKKIEIRKRNQKGVLISDFDHSIWIEKSE